MRHVDVRGQWETAAAGWGRWEPMIAAAMAPATEAMLDMAGVAAGQRVLDLACGAGSQTVWAAQRVGPDGHVIANDIAEPMLRHVREAARSAELSNITTVACAAEDLDVAERSLDAAICRLGLMLFIEPTTALAAVRRALRIGGKVAVVVFSTPQANPFMARPMEILLRHAGKTPPAPGQPGIFALGNPGALQKIFAECGFARIEERTVTVTFTLPSAMDALTMMQQAFGAYRAVIQSSPAAVQEAAWSEVAAALETFESNEFTATGEVLVTAGTNPG